MDKDNECEHNKIETKNVCSVVVHTVFLQISIPPWSLCLFIALSKTGGGPRALGCIYFFCHVKLQKYVH